MINWQDNSKKEVFKSTLGIVNIKVDCNSVVIDDYFEKEEYEKVSNEILNTAMYQEKLVFYNGCLKYNIKNYV